MSEPEVRIFGDRVVLYNAEGHGTSLTPDEALALARSLTDSADRLLGNSCRSTAPANGARCHLRAGHSLSHTDGESLTWVSQAEMDGKSGWDDQSLLREHLEVPAPGVSDFSGDGLDMKQTNFEALAHDFHDRTGRCLAGGHRECARIEAEHQTGEHRNCLIAECNEPWDSTDFHAHCTNPLRCRSRSCEVYQRIARERGLDEPQDKDDPQEKISALEQRVVALERRVVTLAREADKTLSLLAGLSLDKGKR